VLRSFRETWENFFEKVDLSEPLLPSSLTPNYTTWLLSLHQKLSVLKQR